jgi:hypothetical protein
MSEFYTLLPVIQVGRPPSGARPLPFCEARAVSDRSLSEQDRPLPTGTPWFILAVFSAQPINEYSMNRTADRVNRTSNC